MGVTFDIATNKFVFDFEHDGAEDIISLTGTGYQVEAFGKCFYYGYEFSEHVESSVRTAFIKYVKENEPGLDYNVEIQKPESLGGGSMPVFLQFDQFIFLTDTDWLWENA